MPATATATSTNVNDQQAENDHKASVQAECLAALEVIAVNPINTLVFNFQDIRERLAKAAAKNAGAKGNVTIDRTDIDGLEKFIKGLLDMVRQAQRVCDNLDPNISFKKKQLEAIFGEDFPGDSLNCKSALNRLLRNGTAKKAVKTMHDSISNGGGTTVLVSNTVALDS